MSEWWTYRPADFLMFAPRSYWRLFELHNQALWPWQGLLVALGLLAMVLLAMAPQLRHRSAPTPVLRFTLAGLALAWAGVGWGFLLQRYAPINWAAQGFALGFGLQALLLAGLAAEGALRPAAAVMRRRLAMTLGLLALLAYPLLAPSFGRPLWQAEVFGVAPDPTACATLAALLGVQGGSPLARGLLTLAWGCALAWCAVSTATLWTMGSVQAAVPAAFALAALVAARWGRARAGQG